MLTKADEGGGGVYDPPILADVICEQPLNAVHVVSDEDQDVDNDDYSDDYSDEDDGGEKDLFIVGVLGTRSLDEVSGRDDLRLVLPGTHFYQNDHPDGCFDDMTIRIINWNGQKNHET